VIIGWREVYKGAINNHFQEEGALFIGDSWGDTAIPAKLQGGKKRDMKRKLTPGSRDARGAEKAGGKEGGDSLSGRVVLDMERSRAEGAQSWENFPETRDHSLTTQVAKKRFTHKTPPPPHQTAH